ncbi:MAG: DUF4202 family protein [bacterium]
MDKFALIKKEIKKIMLESPIKFDPMHSKITLDWVLRLKPNADEALQIAALAHDIDRPITGITETFGLKNLSNLEEFKREHAKRSAKIIAEIMKKYAYSEAVIIKAAHLVEKHEEGGDEESNILMDADSIAYFDYNLPWYFEKNGKNKTQDKIKFMYNRLSVKGKNIVDSMKFSSKDVADLFKEATKK